MLDFNEFIAWEQASRDTIDFKKIYVDMVDDLTTGLLLSQIMFWHLPDKKGKSKLRVFKDGHYWLAKQLPEWWDEVRMTPRQVKRSLKILADKGIIEKRNYRFNGLRTNHIRILNDGFMEAWQRSLPKVSTESDDSDSTVGTKGTDRKVQKVPTESDKKYRPITETTTETTKKNTSSSCATEKPKNQSLGKQIKNDDDDDFLNSFYQKMDGLGFDLAGYSSLVKDRKPKELDSEAQLLIDFFTDGGNIPRWAKDPYAVVIAQMKAGTLATTIKQWRQQQSLTRRNGNRFSDEEMAHLMEAQNRAVSDVGDYTQDKQYQFFTDLEKDDNGEYIEVEPESATDSPMVDTDRVRDELAAVREKLSAKRPKVVAHMTDHGAYSSQNEDGSYNL